MRMFSREAGASITFILILIFSISSPIIPSEYNLTEVQLFEKNSPAIIVEDLPPLLCPIDDGRIDWKPCDTPDRLPNRDGKHAEEDYGWWFSYSPDWDNNGMDDRLQRIISGEFESPSSTSIIGVDGRSTVAIFVDYAWHPDTNDLNILKSLLFQYGWDESSSEFYPLMYLDSVMLDHVPVSALYDIWTLEGVVAIEMQDIYKPFLDVSSKATVARSSDVYLTSAHSMGYRGDDVVIAVLDTGVDNEHRSLNDFDDVNDDPNVDPGSYNDQKWVAGYDATSTFSNTDGSDDPDDSNGHGTHVAGTALGTGGSSRNFMGVAPGSYLVDVKVLTDAGGTNSGYTARGIEWITQNNATQWGNNGSSNGIHVASMSFGSVETFGGQESTGDNGTSANARLVDRASEEGITCVVAIGNDGRRNVPSPGSADKAITVGAVNDKNTIIRDDDTIADYSNFGPRNSDGDEDRWDELKPTVVASGSNINAPMFAAGSLPIPNQERPLADDEYQEQSGTSMATPHVSGVVALLLSKYPTLTPQQVKNTLINSSMLPDGIGITNTDDGLPDGAEWNSKWGFGSVDAAAIFGISQETTVIGSGLGLVDIGSPTNDSWVIEGIQYRVKGTLDFSNPLNTSVAKIAARVLNGNGSDGRDNQGFSSLDEVIAWHDAVGVDNWYFDIVPNSNWLKWERDTSDKNKDPPEPPKWTQESHDCTSGRTFDSNAGSPNDLDTFDPLYSEYCRIHVEVVALNDLGVVIGSDVLNLYLAEMDITFDEPSGYSELEGTVILKGHYQGPEITEIQYKVDNGDWKTHVLDTSYNADCDGNVVYPYCDFDIDMFNEYEEGEWQIFWDTRDVYDGRHRMTVRLVNASGVMTDEIRHTYEIDNLPPSPDLGIFGAVHVLQNGLPVEEAYVNSILSIRFDVINNGDKMANSAVATISGGNSQGEVTIGTVETSSVKTIEIPWTPTNIGTITLNISTDEADEDGDPDYSDNTRSIQFPVISRPSGVDLALLEGNINVVDQFGFNKLPRPNEPFRLRTYVQNLGSDTSDQSMMTLEYRSLVGWDVIGQKGVNNVAGNGGKVEVSEFDVTVDSVGAHKFRLSLSNISSDIDTSNNELEFEVVVDYLTILGNETVQLPSNEVPVSYASVGDGGHLLTTKDGELRLKTISSRLQMLGDVRLDENFAGDADIIRGSDETSYLTWTRRYTNDVGYIMMTVSFASLDKNGQISEIQDLMPPVRLIDGQYWGLDLTYSDGKYAIAGYHRDVTTGGSYLDITSVFLLTTESPLDSDSWLLSPKVVSDLDVHPQNSDPVSVAIGVEKIHLLYQSNRDDSVGESRLGIFYAKGNSDENFWNLQLVVGDYASQPQLMSMNSGDEDVLYAVWKEFEFGDAKLVTWITDSKWDLDDRVDYSAPGMNRVKLMEYERGIQLIYDQYDMNGPRIMYGILSSGGEERSLSSKITNGVFFDASHNPKSTHVIYYTNSGQLSIRALAEDTVYSADEKSFLDMLVDAIPADEKTARLVLNVIGAGLISLFMLIFVIAILGRRNRRRKLRDKVDEIIVNVDTGDLDIELADDDFEEFEVAISLEPDETDVIEINLPEINQESDNQELEEDLATPSESRRRRRETRVKSQKEAELIASLPPLDELPPFELPGVELGELPPLPLPEIKDLPPLPQLERSVNCDSCNAVFTVKDMNRKSIKCPICDHRMKI